MVDRQDASAEQRTEDALSNQRILVALFGEEDAAVKARDPSISSHLQLDYNKDGEPTLLRFVYVDEQECIGCTYCASVARNTFFMEPDSGRARAFSQGTDDPEILLEAIDCCPVNCISFVDHEDLVILESERDGLAGEEGITIDQRSIGMKHGDSYYANRRTPTKAKLNSGAMCCNNCPMRGCKDCPMYGVGLNPVYIKRAEERAAKREARGEAAKERFDTSVQEQLDFVYTEPLGGEEQMLEEQLSLGMNQDETWSTSTNRDVSDSDGDEEEVRRADLVQSIFEECVLDDQFNDLSLDCLADLHPLQDPFQDDSSVRVRD